MNSHYPIFCFEGPPIFDALPVLKVTSYPFETADYKPFAQGLLCMSGGRLMGRLWAFEARPEAGSTLSLALKGGSAHYALSLRLDGVYTAYLNGETFPMPSLRPIAGEDLQGEYWGVDFDLGEQLSARLGLIFPYKGQLLEGNIYKSCEGARPHFGSYAPVLERDSTATPAAFELLPY